MLRRFELPDDMLDRRPCGELLRPRMDKILGGGKTIFPDDGVLRALELTSTITSPAGVVVSTYRPVRSA